MQVTNCGRGIHCREIKGIERLKSALPNNWYSFTNLELIIGPGQSREVDVVLVADDRIFLIDLKDWSGKIESANGDWIQNGENRGPSPVPKISNNARELGIILGEDLRRRKGKSAIVPRVFGLVVITGNRADFSGISAIEAASVLRLDDFVKAVTSVRARIDNFGGAHPAIVADPLTSPAWKDQLSKFFNAKAGKVRPGRRRYGNFVALSDDASYEHPGKIYSEYDASDEHAVTALGTLRVWDFTKAETRFQSEEGRREIAGRERSVVAYLQDRNERSEQALLLPRAEDPERGVNYWEVYDRRRRLKRLSEFMRTDGLSSLPEARVELARQLISNVALLHSADAAHLDVGGHSVWLEEPSTARLSHLMAARFSDERSLGASRYQFLSSAVLPEDVLGGGGDDAFRRDVFLLGVSVHQIVFGSQPAREGPGMPPQWTAAIDAAGEYTALHGWFEAALSLAPSDRYRDANKALDAFNDATATRPSRKEVLEGLESFRTGPIRSQRQLYAAYPDDVVVQENDRLDAWVSRGSGAPVLVKLWKRAAWGDQDREGPRILAFLTKAQDLALSPPPGCARFNDVIWLGDSMAIVQEYVEGDTLEQELESPDSWSDPSFALTFLKQLADTVLDLHARGLAHGDLKPGNIVVDRASGALPILIDLVDFSPSTDGEIQTSKYAPPAGGSMERDRFAVAKIAEELMSVCPLAESVSKTISDALHVCRDSTPPNATLLPFVEALERAIAPAAVGSALEINISLRGAETGPIFPDEGQIFVRRSVDGRSILLRGAVEEVEITLDGDGRPLRGRRLQIDQKKIAAVSRFEFMHLEAVLSIQSSAVNDFSGLDLLLAMPELTATDSKREVPATDVDEEEVEEDTSAAGRSDQQLDVQAAVVVREGRSPTPIDLKGLWRRLVDAEADLTTEGFATAPSAWDNVLKRHVIPFELSNGTFDFSKGDTVGVERLDRKGGWRRLGELDIARSKPDRILLDTFDAMPTTGSFVAEDQSLRFTSHFETQSFKRRESAISRVLARQSRVADLVDIFDPSKEAAPRPFTHEIEDSKLDIYRLNDAQKNAFRNVVSTRPLGLVQGPPGTGKTVFIAALAHYALTHNLARNILLASQSHEAVNNAAEAVLRLFVSEKTQPRILRVGNESVVSDRLLQFHTDRVEQLYKDRFSAEVRARLQIAGSALGIPAELGEGVAFIETAVRPVVELLGRLSNNPEPEIGRINGLRDTLRRQLEHIELKLPPMELDPFDAEEYLSKIVQAAAAKYSDGEIIDPNRIGRLRAIAQLGRDFVASTSTAQRGFEPFLAGTRQIVAGTCVGLGRPSLGLTSTPFDLVIVDEAARCTASELSVPMQAGRWVVLVGDHAQLEPQHDATLVKQVSTELRIPQREVLKSDFERVFTTGYGGLAGQTLTTQYRMLPAIGRVVSKVFYDTKLAHGRTDHEVDPSVLPRELTHPIAWISTDEMGANAFQKREQYSTSLTNPSEADIIVSLLKRWGDHKPFVEWLGSQTRYAQPIGIIAMYASQRDLIRRQIDRTALADTLRRSLKIDTVDSYQGKENPIVLLSLVRNNADGAQEGGAATIDPGFLIRPNRINVAVSRAMDRLVLVGGMKRWKSGTPMGDLTAAIQTEIEGQEGVVITPSGLVEPQEKAS